MTVREKIAECDELYPNSMTDAKKKEWLYQLDRELYDKVVLTHEDWETVPVPDMDDEDRELLVQQPYDSIYLHWLQSRIDYTMGDTARYNNSNAQCEADRVEWRNMYNRLHMPIAPKSVYF